MLNKVKLMLGLSSTDKDDLLTLLIDNAIEDARNYTHNDSIKDLEAPIIKMVCFNYNRLGTEGVSGEAYNGVSFDYVEDYPETILRSLRAHRKVRVV